MTLSTFTLDTDKLTSYLKAHVEGFEGPLTAEKFSGGQSNPTYLVTAASGKYVLRHKPPGELLKSAHAIDREYKVISSLAKTGVPVPNTYTFCDDDSVIGSMFYLMEYIDGRVLWDPALPSMNNDERSAIYTEMNRVLAELHSVDIEAAGLSDYGRPGNYFERQIGRWSKQYRAAETQTIAEMEHLLEWLPANMPKDDGRVALAHGDFRLDNMMFHPNKATVLALVDWELSTLGHPFADLAYQCMQLRMMHNGPLPGLGDIDRKSLGIPTEQEYVSMYCDRMGLDEIPHWNFYLVFSFFRFASIMQGIKKRAIDGNASSDKATQMGALVTPLAQLAVELCS